jgi:inosine-uridine nucleoside N-ribohydrolase
LKGKSFAARQDFFGRFRRCIARASIITPFSIDARNSPRYFPGMSLEKRPFARNHFCLIWLIIFALAAVLAVSAEPVKIIMDVDMAEDVDDVGAVAVLHALADRGEAEILGFMVSSKNESVVPCLDAINTWYGRADLPIGYQHSLQYGYHNPDDPGRETPSKYAEAVAKNFPHRLQRSSDAPEAAKLCRKLLATQPDHSVTIVSTGFLCNLRDLLDSPPDELSLLNGEALVKLKVKQWVCMGGIFPGGKFPNGDGEYNLMWDTAASVRVVNDWPTPVVFSGFEIGARIKTGSRLRETSEKNPARACYEHYNGLNPRESWDETAVLYAVRGPQDYWDLSAPGFCVMHARVPFGYNQWIPAQHGPHRYLVEKKSPAEMSRLIEDLMVQPPRPAEN